MRIANIMSAHRAQNHSVCQNSWNSELKHLTTQSLLRRAMEHTVLEEVSQHDSPHITTGYGSIRSRLCQQILLE